MIAGLVSVFVENLLPILLATGVGYVAGAALGLEARSLARLGFNVFGPCLVFKLLTGTELSGSAMAGMAAVTALSLLGVAGIAFVIGRIMGLRRRPLAALVLVAMLPNAGNYGLSLVRMAFGQEALAHAGVFFVTSSVVLYTVGVFVASLGTVEPRQALFGLARVPAIYAVLVALVVVRMDLTIPLPIDRTVTILSEAAIPVFLVVLGLELRRAGSLESYRVLGLGIGLRLVVSPILALVLVRVLGITGSGREAGLVESAMPVAVATTVLAETYDIEPGFITAAVLVSTVLSPLTLTPLLAWLGAG